MANRLGYHVVYSIYRVSRHMSVPRNASKDGRPPHRQQVALVDELALALLQLRAQAPQLALVLTQQRALVHVLVHLNR